LMLDTDFEPKIKEKISLIKQFLGSWGIPLSSPARLPDEYSFQWVRFGITWLILWRIESGTFDGFPPRSHRAKNKHVLRWAEIFFKFSG
jgi:hypothetical protein